MDDGVSNAIVIFLPKSVLPDDKILFGNYSHQHAQLDENGVELNEADAMQQPPGKLGIDFRIPNVASPAGGMCSR